MQRRVVLQLGLEAAAHTLAYFSQSLILHGSHGLNRYLPPAHALTPSDVDIMLVSDAPEELLAVVLHHFHALVKSAAFPRFPPSMSTTFMAEANTTQVFLNGHKIMDITPYTTRTRARFWTPNDCFVVMPNGSHLTFRVLALPEMLHRMSAVVHGEPYRDGTCPPDPRANEWRVRRDTERLCRLSDLHVIGSLLSSPRPWHVHFSTDAPLDAPATLQLPDGFAMPLLRAPLRDALRAFSQGLCADMGALQGAVFAALDAQRRRADVLLVQTARLRLERAREVVRAWLTARLRARRARVARALRSRLLQRRRRQLARLQAAVLAAVRRGERKKLAPVAGLVKDLRHMWMTEQSAHYVLREVVKGIAQKMTPLLTTLAELSAASGSLSGFAEEYRRLGRELCTAGLYPFSVFPAVTGGMPFFTLPDFGSDVAVRSGLKYNLLAWACCMMEFMTRKTPVTTISRVPSPGWLTGEQTVRRTLETMSRNIQAFDEDNPVGRLCALPYVMSDGCIGVGVFPLGSYVQCSEGEGADADHKSEDDDVDDVKEFKGGESVASSSTSDPDYDSDVVSDTDGHSPTPASISDAVLRSTERVKISHGSHADPSTSPPPPPPGTPTYTLPPHAHFLELPLNGAQLQALLAMCDTLLTTLAAPFLSRMSKLSVCVEVAASSHAQLLKVLTRQGVSEATVQKERDTKRELAARSKQVLDELTAASASSLPAPLPVSKNTALSRRRRRRARRKPSAA